MHNVEYDAKGNIIDRVTLVVKPDIYGYVLSCVENHSIITRTNTVERMNLHLEEIVAHEFESQFLTMHMVRYYTVIWYL